MMRVLLAVEQDGLRSALHFVLEQESGMQLVGLVADAAALQSACADLLPDVLLVDWDLPGLQREHRDQRGDRTLGRLYAAAPLLQVIVLGGRPEVRAAAMAAGAHRFVSKTDPPEKLIAALRLAGNALPPES
ncbi:MAG: response regulator [Caldilineaceae bacterium]